jgi:hypothetical protein
MMKCTVIATAAAVLGASMVTRADQITFKMEPMLNVPTDLEDSFGGWFFEPILPETSRTCGFRCPMGPDLYTEETCPVEGTTACGGNITVDLSAQTAQGTGIESNQLVFEWKADADETKFIAIDGTGRTRIEFQATYDCDDQASTYQEILGADISYEFDFVERDSSVSHSYVYNADSSFMDIGKCDGCGSCEIYTRLQFDPMDGALRLSFESLTFRATYDPSLVEAGDQTYRWGTGLYTWMRDSQNRRLLNWAPQKRRRSLTLVFPRAEI